MHDLAAGLRDRVEDRRVPVAERRAHLPGGEVQDPPPVLGLQPAALGAVDDELGERAAVTDQLRVDPIGGVDIAGIR